MAYDLAGGVAGSALWPYTVRFQDQEGGTVRIAQPGILVDPWNPVAGSNWIYDIDADPRHEDAGYMTDPYTGLYLAAAHREGRDHREGRPAGRQDPGLDHPEHSRPPSKSRRTPGLIGTLSTRSSSPSVSITPRPRPPTPRYVVTYPADLWTTVKWHDGSPITMGDFIMGMILTFDRGKADSAIFDDAR